MFGPNKGGFIWKQIKPRLQIRDAAVQTFRQILLTLPAPVVRGERQHALPSLTYHLTLRRAERLTSLGKEPVATCLLYLISAISSSEHFPFVFKWKPFVAQGQIIEVTRVPAGVYLFLCGASCRQKY